MRKESFIMMSLVSTWGYVTSMIESGRHAIIREREKETCSIMTNALKAKLSLSLQIFVSMNKRTALSSLSHLRSIIVKRVHRFHLQLVTCVCAEAQCQAHAIWCNVIPLKEIIGRWRMVNDDDTFNYQWNCFFFYQLHSVLFIACWSS